MFTPQSLKEKYNEVNTRFKNTNFYSSYILDIYLADTYKEKMDVSRKNTKKFFKYFTQRHTRGFDDRETWNLNTTMIKNLYERVKKYQELSIVDTDATYITIDGKSQSLTYWLNIIVSNCEEILIQSSYEKNLDDLLLDMPKDYVLVKGGNEEFYELTDEKDRTFKEEKMSYWVDGRLQALEYDKSACEKEVWEIWSVISPHVWW